jgi:integrase
MPRRNEGPKLKWHRYGAAFYICWTENGRSRERSTGTADREQAEIIFAEWLQARGRKSGPSDPSQILITDILTDYATERATKVAAPRIIGCAIDSLSCFWEARTVVEVTPQTCSRYGDWRCRSQNTVRRELAVLKAAINSAHRNGKITRPVAVTLPAKPASKERWLTREEAALLLRASRTPQARLYLPLFILLGLYTGRRKEAILSLRWPQVNLDAGLIDFELVGRQRTNKKRGKVPIPRKLLSHLRRARRRGSDLGHVLHIDGEPIGDIKKGFAAACRRAGILGVTPHTLRHTAATWLMQRGTPLWEASGFLAMSEKTLVEVYGHHHPEYMREAAEAINKSLPRNFRVMK